MEVRDRQQLGFALLQPAGAGHGLTLGTVTVAARVVRDLAVVATRAGKDVTSQRGRPAGLELRQHAALGAGKPRALSVQKGSRLAAKDLRDFQVWPYQSALRHPDNRGA